MATLIDDAGRTTPLRSHHLIGRSRSMHTTLPDRQISAQHAAILWTGERWVLRDLGSRNGTFLDGQRIEPGASAQLAAGGSLRFGDSERRFTVASVAPPAPWATRDGGLVEGSEEHLALPSDDDPVALILFEPDRGWLLSGEDTPRPLEDGQILTVAGETWTLSLPEAVGQTLDARRSEPAAAEIALRFAVSADEEYVELVAVIDGAAHPLAPRAYHYLLLVMARARLEDADAPERERGWIYTSDLVRMLRVTPNQVYVGLHRAKKQLAALSPTGAQSLIEKRATTRQVRLGIARLEVAPL